LRSTDIFGRLGGEEFGILLPECTLAQVLVLAEQIRVKIATASAGEDAPDIPISASFGISSVVHSGYELRQLLIHADEALYRAKREGRNRVSIINHPECDNSTTRDDLVDGNPHLLQGTSTFRSAPSEQANE